MKRTITIEELNQEIRQTLDNFYRDRDADSFFRIDSLLNFCRRNELTDTEIPALIEMQNVIVMG